jgi:membrane-bound lytic murein transglycosylase F
MFASVLIALCLSPMPLPDADQIPGLQHGTLRVAVWAEASPDLFAVQRAAVGQPGFEREIIEGFAALHRLQIEVVPAPGVDKLIPLLLADKADLIAGGFTETEARRKVVDFSAEIFPIRYVVLTARPHPPIRSLEALRAAERVGTIKGTSWAEELAKTRVGNVDDSYASTQQLIAALRAGRIAATVMSVRTAIFERQKQPELEFGFVLDSTTRGCYGVPKNRPELLHALDAYIENVRHTATWSRLVIKYFGEDALEVLKSSRQ